MKKRFDVKFGEEFFLSLPHLPGVYRLLGETGTVIYVGKAKNLRRRLLQYRNAKRRKAHRKMRTLVQEAHEILWEVCASETEALLRETHLIQTLRPKFNVAGAFSFLYPFIGIQEERGVLQIFLTHRPDFFPNARIYGCFRSQSFTLKALDLLETLLAWVAVRVPRREPAGHGVFSSQGRIRPDKLIAFRGIHPSWVGHLESFLLRGARDALTQLVLDLADQPQARSRPGQVQDCLNFLEYFRRHEILTLHRATTETQFPSYPVSQTQRDPLLIHYRAQKNKPNQLTLGP